MNSSRACAGCCWLAALTQAEKKEPPAVANVLRDGPIAPVIRLMSLPRLLSALLLSVTFAFASVEVTDGMTREEVIALAGKPVSELTRGERTFMMYPNKGKVELLNGRVVDVVRVKVINPPPEAAAPEAQPAPAAPAAGATPASAQPAPKASVPAKAVAPAAPAQTPSQAPAKAPAKTAPAASNVAPAAAPSPAGKPAAPAATATVPAPGAATVPAAASTMPASAAEAQKALEREEIEEYGRVLTPEERAKIAEMEKAREKYLNGEADKEYDSGISSSKAYWIMVLLQCVFTIPITAMILKVSFKWCDVDADWKQMWLPAAVDTFTRAGVQVLIYVWLETSMTFHIDDLLAFFALLTALLKTTHACTFQRAVAVAVIAKIAGIIVWALLSVFLLRLAIGGMSML